jgi:hypothetical protein
MTEHGVMTGKPLIESDRVEGDRLRSARQISAASSDREDQRPRLRGDVVRRFRHGCGYAIPGASDTTPTRRLPHRHRKASCAGPHARDQMGWAIAVANGSCTITTAHLIIGACKATPGSGIHDHPAWSGFRARATHVGSSAFRQCRGGKPNAHTAARP